jgi:hypothetical protein
MGKFLTHVIKTAPGASLLGAASFNTIGQSEDSTPVIIFFENAFSGETDYVRQCSHVMEILCVTPSLPKG